jgi:hypothetical protein
MLVQEQRAWLAHGLDDLRRSGEVADSDPTAGRQFLFDARLNLAGSRSSYTQQLSDQLSRPAPAEPAYLWMLARHLALPTLAETACHLRLGQPAQGMSVLRAGLTVLSGHASAVFERTVAANPARFLMPSLARQGVTLEVIAELFRQARHAGVVPEEQAVTEAGVFESLRGRLHEASDPTFGRERKIKRLRSEFAEASAAVEEVNRVRGLALAIEQCERGGRDYLALTEQILGEIAAPRPQEGTCFAVFPPLGRE